MTYQESIGRADVAHELPRVRKIGPRDLWDALAKGWDDFWAMPTHLVFLSLIYPIIGLLIGGATFGYNLLPLFYPMAAGFALLGPLDRDRPLRTQPPPRAGPGRAVEPRLRSAAGGFVSLHPGARAGAAGAVRAVDRGGAGDLRGRIWLLHAPPDSIEAFARQVLTTPAGHRMILIGNGVGLLFALVAFAISVVAFPLLIDRNIGATAAALTSVRAVLRNPLTMLLWGLIVAVALLIGSLPFFLGLAIVLPVLGHATWHLYRKVVVPDLPPREVHPAPPKGKRYAADFPAVLFPVHDKEP